MTQKESHHFQVCMTAVCRRVDFKRPLPSMLEPYSKSNFMTSILPLNIAKCSVEKPNLSVALTSAPFQAKPSPLYDVPFAPQNAKPSFQYCPLFLCLRDTQEEAEQPPRIHGRLLCAMVSRHMNLCHQHQPMLPLRLLRSRRSQIVRQDAKPEIVTRFKNLGRIACTQDRIFAPCFKNCRTSPWMSTTELPRT